MNRNETIAAVKALGLKCAYLRQTGEYRVAHAGLTRDREEAGAYYTDDKEDALGTARLMAVR